MLMVGIITFALLTLILLVETIRGFFYFYKKYHRTIHQRISQDLLAVHRFQLIEQTDQHQWFSCYPESVHQLWLLIDGVHFENSQPNYNGGVKLWLVTEYQTADPTTLVKNITVNLPRGRYSSPYQRKLVSLPDTPDILENQFITIGPIQQMRQRLHMPVDFPQNDSQLLAMDCTSLFSNAPRRFQNFLNDLVQAETNDAARCRTLWRRRLLVGASLVVTLIFVYLFPLYRTLTTECNAWDTCLNRQTAELQIQFDTNTPLWVAASVPTVPAPAGLNSLRACPTTFITWGDGERSSVSSCTNSGSVKKVHYQLMIQASHTYSQPGTYTITAHIRDTQLTQTVAVPAV